MADDPPEGGLEGLLGECGVPPGITSGLIMAGWTTETFAACSASLSGFDAVWPELLPDHPEISLLDKSAIRTGLV